MRRSAVPLWDTNRLQQNQSTYPHAWLAAGIRIFNLRWIMRTMLGPVAVLAWAVFWLLPTASCSRGKPVAEVHAAASAEVQSLDQPGSLPPIDDADWPWWRGPQRNGVASGLAPTEWSDSKNVLWKTSVPGRGHASPTIWGNQIFLAAADEAAHKMSLLSYSRDDGRLLWEC